MRIRKRNGRQPPLLLIGALASGLLLTACTADEPEVEIPAMPFDAVAMPVDSAPAVSPGQHLTTGGIALLPQTDHNGAPLDSIETTVIGVIEGDPSFWETFDNGSEFANDTPFFTVIQYRWVTGTVSDRATPLLRPILDDGSEGGIVQLESLGALTADSVCPFEIERFDEDTTRGPNEFITCVLYTAPIGSTLVGLAWHNTQPSLVFAPEDDVNPFYSTPAVWDVAPLPPTAD